jgi:hypothetical protein
MVKAQKKPQATTVAPPVRIRYLTGNRSANMPKGRFDKAMPKVTADTESDAQEILTENCLWRIGKTG